MGRALTLIAVAVLGFYLTPVNAQPLPNTPWPEWVFHHWVWEDESTQQSAIQLVDDYLAHDIPVGAIIIDSPWETGYNTFDWDSSLFPDPQAMVNYFHSKNVKVLVWITTAINFDTLTVPYDPVRDSLYDYAAAHHYFMQKHSNTGPAKIKWWKGWGSMIDLFNPAAVAWWKGLMDKTLALGIDGWKCDGTDYTLIDPNDLLNPALYSPGRGANVTREEYSEAYYRLFHDYTRQQLGNDRVNMSRPIDNYGVTFLSGSVVAFTPKDIGWACWVGDQDATFAGMKNALNNMYQSDDYGYLIFGSDIGGYREEPVANGRDKNLFIRWAQLGAFSPLMENGGGGEHRPWIFDQQTADIYRTFAKLHHALIPYFMKQSDSLFTAGESMMQFFNSSNYRYMLGSDIFVAPVLSSSTTISIDFPPSDTTWVYLFDHSKVYQGGTSASLTVPLEEYPVFLKASSALMTTLDTSAATGMGKSLRSNKNEVTVYPNPANNEFSVEGLNLKVGQTGEIRLYNVLGKEVLVSPLTIDYSSVTVRGLERGVYFYQINVSGFHARHELINGKVVIQ